MINGGWFPALIAVLCMLGLWTMWRDEPRDDDPLSASRGVLSAILIMCVVCIMFQAIFVW